MSWLVDLSIFFFGFWEILNEFLIKCLNTHLIHLSLLF